MSQIKQLQPKEGVALLAVKVAPDATNFRIANGFPDPPKGDLAYDTKLNVWQTGDAILPEGNWKLLGKATEIPEEVWQGIVGTVKPHAAIRTYYLSYANKAPFYKTATEAAMSFLEANEVYSVNPYGFPGCECPSNANKDVTDKCESDNARWSKAQENTGTWLIIIKQ